MDAAEFHRRAGAELDQRVQKIGDDQWSLSTPCTEWDVRQLVEHNVNENLWVPAICTGRTIAEIEASDEIPDGDPLGDDPKSAWASGLAAAAAAVDDGQAGDVVHLSFGDLPMADYARQRGGDLMIHAWDLARAIGADETLDPVLVEDFAAWAEPQRPLIRSMPHVFGPEVGVASDADPQVRLLALFGRDGS